MRILLLSIALIALVGCGDVNLNDSGNSNGGNANDNANSSGPTAQPPSEVSRDAVTDVLTKWRNRIYPTLGDTERQEIETFAAAFPLAAPAGTEPIIIESSDDEPPQLTPVINRRDWAYALRGAAHTLAGGFVKDQADLLDVGFWCFLEAALLQTDEPEHLTNVAFHLNEREEYADARTVLLYARSLEDTYAPTRNNLAFTYAGQGDYGVAIDQQLDAVMLQPDTSLYIEGLAAYYDHAGMESEAQIARALLEDGATLPSVPGSTQPGDLSLPASHVLLELVDLSLDMLSEMAMFERDSATELRINALDEEYLGGVADREHRCIIEITYEEEVADPLVECKKCWFPAAAARWNLRLAIYQLEKNLAFAHIAHLFRVRAEYLPRGMEVIERAGLGEADRRTLADYWDNNGLATARDIAAGILQDLEAMWAWVEHDRIVMSQLPCVGVGGIPFVKEEDPICKGFIGNYLFCTHWELSLGFIGFEFDPDKETVQLTLGQGLQGSFEYNFKKGLARIGVGIGVNYDKLIRAGATVKYSPSSGFDASMDVKAGLPSVLPTPAAPAIAKLVVFTNH